MATVILTVRIDDCPAGEIEDSLLEVLREWQHGEGWVDGDPQMAWSFVSFENREPEAHDPETSDAVEGF